MRREQYLIFYKYGWLNERNGRFFSSGVDSAMKFNSIMEAKAFLEKHKHLLPKGNYYIERFLEGGALCKGIFSIDTNWKSIRLSINNR